MVQEEWNAYVFTLVQDVFFAKTIFCVTFITRASEAKLCLERILKLYSILSCENSSLFI